MILLVGCKGMLGSEFSNIYKNSLQLDMHNCDVSEYKNLMHYDRLDFDYIINCAAFTNVDACEDIENREAVLKSNVVGVKNLVEFANHKKAKLIHFSTDYVFSGDTTTCYKEEDERNPIQFYGETKLQSEIEIQNHCNDYLIIRISWLFGRNGSNFINYVLNSLKQNKEISLLDSNFGTPTSTIAILNAFPVLKKQSGILHFTNKSENLLSWFDYGKKIADIASLNGDLIKPISYLERPAKRPTNSTLCIEKTLLLTNIEYWHLDLTKVLLNVKQ